MPPWLRLMSLLGILAAGAGMPLLVTPATVRATFGLRATPEIAYILRIVGAMLAALALIMFAFALAYWRATLDS